MELTFDSFINQVVTALGPVGTVETDRYNEGQFSATLHNGTVVRVFGGSNLFGSEERLEGPLRWEIRVPSVALLKMASGSFVQEPCMASSQGWTLEEAINANL